MHEKELMYVFFPEIKKEPRTNRPSVQQERAHSGNCSQTIRHYPDDHQADVGNSYQDA